MAISKSKLSDNLDRVRERIAAACDRTRRDSREVSLVAVTKAAESASIRDLISLGHVDVAENRIQQLTQRAAEIDAWLARRKADDRQVRWHMVGHLQRNKVKACLAVADVIHSVDSLRLAEEISARAEQNERVIECLMEVNCYQESQKQGVAVGAAFHLAEQIATLPGLRLTGLMTMAPMVADTERARFAFVRLRELFEEMRNEKIGGREFRHLSMGMSNDFEVAVEEGATILRIGTALFT